MAESSEESWNVVGPVKRVPPVAARPSRSSGRGGRGGRAGGFADRDDEKEVTVKHPQRWRIEAASIRAAQAEAVTKGKGA